MTCWHEITDKNGRKTGRLAKCASDPCPIPGHADTDIHADNAEQAYEKLHERDDGDAGMGMREPTPLYHGVFFDRNRLDELVDGNIPNRHGLPREIRNPHVTFGFHSQPVEGFHDGMGVNGFRIIGYGNDGVNEGLLVRIPKRMRRYYQGASQAHITLSLAEGGQPKDTAKLDFTPLDKPFILDGGITQSVMPKQRKPKETPQGTQPTEHGKNVGNAGKPKRNRRKPKQNGRNGLDEHQTISPHWNGGRGITRRHFNGVVNGVGNAITEDDWNHLSQLSDSIMEIQGGGNGNRNEIRKRIAAYLESDDGNAVRFRAYCGDDVSMDDMSALLTNNVGAMTGRYRYSETGRKGTSPSLKRCMMSNMSNDMNKRKYIASIMFFGGRCCYCGMPLHKGQRRVRDPQAATGEHIDPIGGNPPGETKFGNMALCCRRCNADKADKPFASWLENTDMLTSEQKLSAMSGIMSFRNLSFYERMGASKAKAVETAIVRIKAFRRANPGDESAVNMMLGHETMRIQQMQ